MIILIIHWLAGWLAVSRGCIRGCHSTRLVCIALNPRLKSLFLYLITDHLDLNCVHVSSGVSYYSCHMPLIYIQTAVIAAAVSADEIFRDEGKI